MFEVISCGVVSALAILILAARLRLEPSKNSPTLVPLEQALAAAGLMKDWAVWLAAIQTALISGLVALYGKGGPLPPVISTACLWYGASLVVETALLAGLPSVVLAFTDDAVEAKRGNNIFDMPFFDWRLRRTPVRVGVIYMLAHWFFLFGLTATALQFLFFGVPKWPHS